MEKHQLSKSTFLRGLQCEKSLYFYKHHYDLKDEVSAQQQAIFDQGAEVGLLAQKLFSGGVDASPSSHFEMQEAVLKTKDFLHAGESIIYEATFQFDRVLAALDILVKDAEGWKAYEVKSSTSVKEVYIPDAAVQYHTIVNSGIDLVDISIVYVNNQYVKQGPIDIQQLFSIESVHDRVIALQPEIPAQIERFKNVIDDKSTPEISIGLQCDKPYECDFKGHCWKSIPEYSVFNISKLSKQKKFDLYNRGIITLDQVPIDEKGLNQKQKLQVLSTQNGSSFMDEEKIKNFLTELTYPLYFLDFETMATAVPIYDQSRPYQQIPFQYSLHIQQGNGQVEHLEYLADSEITIDPRIAFIERLLSDCGEQGDILVYNIGFERRILKELIPTFPQHEGAIEAIIRRLKDLMIPFVNKWYYTPEMKGSYSIKYVLPALVPELSYEDLDIREGGTASHTFTEMVMGTFEGDIHKSREALKEYCRMDTLGMVEILSKLKTEVT